MINNQKHTTKLIEEGHFEMTTTRMSLTVSSIQRLTRFTNLDRE
jgi:hypothetical protein